MSLSVETVCESKQVILSEKFKKELIKFIEWVETSDYTLKSVIDGESYDWSIDLLDNFEEPGRNKLESYLKDILKWYFIVENGKEIDNVKIIIKDFKDKESKKETKKESKKVEKENKKVKVNSEVSEVNIANEIDRIITKSGVEIKIVNDADTSGAFNLDTLDLTTKELCDKFENPLKTGKEGEKHRYEWKLSIDSRIYTIYDWMHEDGEFDDFTDCEWFLGGYEERQDDIDNLMLLFNKKPKETNEVIDDTLDDDFLDRTESESSDIENECDDNLKELDESAIEEICEDSALSEVEDEDASDIDFEEELDLDLDDIEFE